VLACDSSKGNAVTFTPTGSNTTYPENAPAEGWAAQEGWAPNDRHIWLTADGRQDDTPNVPRVYGGDVIQEGWRPNSGVNRREQVLASVGDVTRWR
jgi:hypothetical protein